MDFRVGTQKEVEYIPLFGGNREGEKPARYFLRALTSGERAECIKNQIDESGKVCTEVDLVKIFRKGVVRIEDQTINGEPATRADQVVNSPDLYLLMREVASELLLMNGGGNVKNSQ